MAYRTGRRLSSPDRRFAASAVAVGIGLAVLTGHHAGTSPAAAVTNRAVVPDGSESGFIGAVLADLGAPDSQADVESLASWFPHEFPSWPPSAADNPMASTMPEPGSSTFNYAGVQNYASAAQGAQATAATLDDGYYPGIVAALRSGAGLCGDSSLAGEFLTWSGGGYSGVC